MLGRRFERRAISRRGGGRRALSRETLDAIYGRLWYGIAISCIIQTFFNCMGIFLQARKNGLSIQLRKARNYGVGPMDRPPRSIDIPDSDWQFTDECRRGGARVAPRCRPPCINARLCYGERGRYPCCVLVWRSRASRNARRSGVMSEVINISSLFATQPMARGNPAASPVRPSSDVRAEEAPCSKNAGCSTGSTPVPRFHALIQQMRPRSLETPLDPGIQAVILREVLRSGIRGVLPTIRHLIISAITFGPRFADFRMMKTGFDSALRTASRKNAHYWTNFCCIEERLCSDRPRRPGTLIKRSL